MLRILGRDSSSNVQKVLWLSEELGLKYERVDLGGPFGGLEEESFLDLNPNGKIPVIKNDGLVLFESHAILRYLAAKYPISNLWPSTLEELAVCDQWIEWVHSALSTTMPTILVGLLRTPSDKRDLNQINAAHQAAETAWSILNDHLKKHLWIGGEHFTVADIPAGVWAWRRDKLPIECKYMNHIERWYENLRQRPAYQKIVMQPLS